ncbi:MAG: hypothetical protein HKO62_01385, partial [Gammaproteobacteria bacterium]|nr:hypothetical protein [Gammaproteobacteria bacterium]
MNILLVERINDANEYIELLAEAYEANGHTVVLDVQNFLFSSYVPDVVHLHWPEAIYRWRHRLPLDETTITLIEDRLRWYRERGAVIVYTAHNLLPHSAESADFARQIYSRMLTHVDIVLHHGTASIPLLKTELPECAGADHIVAPHGPYKARAL